MEKKYLTIRETAQTGLLSEYTIRCWLKQGKIPHVMAGTRCLINFEGFKTVLNNESMNSIKSA